MKHISRSIWPSSGTFGLLVLRQFYFFLSEGLKNVLNDFEFFRVWLYFGQFIEAFHAVVNDFIKSQYFIFWINSLDTFLSNWHNLVALGLNFLWAGAEPFIGPDLKFGVDGFPEVNEGLKLVKFNVLKIFGLVVNDDSSLRVNKFLDDFQEVVETVDFLEESLIVSQEFIQKVMGENVGQ